MAIPIMADSCSWIGARGCRKENMISLMSKNRNIALLPGGFEEASIYKRNRHKVFIKERKGFIKYALQYGYSVTPCYGFGEEKTYWEINIAPTSWRLWLNKYKIPGIVFIGKYFLLPDNNLDLTMVVGKPIQFPTIAEPTTEDIEKYHAIFIKALQEVFDRNKGLYGAKEAELEVC
jgi:hypothetical protein